MESWLDTINSTNDDFWLWLLIPVLALVSLIYIVRTRVVQIRLLPAMFRTIGEAPATAPDGKKATSAFQAFAISSAARIGTGNVVGVSIAIATGGPGAILWMWIMGVVVSAAAFAESTLAQLYKVRTDIGYRGGPAYYMLHGLGRKWMGALFAVVLILTYPLTFNTVQANTATNALTDAFAAADLDVGSDVNILIGLGLAALVGLIIFGGLRRIAHTTQLLIPFMALLYLIIGTAVVIVNLDAVPGVFQNIFESAFGIRAIGGATLGTVFVIGIQRGMFSNEAGMGSAPNAGATASVSHPVKQGLTQAFGVYFDTLFVCTISALIVLTANPQYGENVGAQLITDGVTSSLGAWAIYPLTLILLLFTFTSSLGNYYYGESNTEFLSQSPVALNLVRSLVVFAVFFGSVASLDLVWSLANISMGIMALINLIAVGALTGVTITLLRDYDHKRRQGIDPVFRKDDYPAMSGVQVWDDNMTQEQPRRSDSTE
ncbi:alanine/glycine:cation symporter family protein [Haloglycomyces albus]|uniref:alanine/glycine:cation symporter family protein n=1 Tax=Haloglycomyces albus TaxID=526067 RepID=UPI00046D0EF4|nr:alanine/glycine:cation symporter family protein [Haloglycomyces albus]